MKKLFLIAIILLLLPQARTLAAAGENGCYILKCNHGNITVAHTKLIINK